MYAILVRFLELVKMPTFSAIRCIAFLCLIMGILSACSGTPNNITMTFNQGQCVQLSEYSSGSQPLAAAAFPQLINNPESAPYCMSVTIYNNNSGQNANNIQTTIGGLQVSYNVGNNYYSASVGDNPASNNGMGYTQTLGNLALFDPNNCATTEGSTVVTINKGGGTCTFYFQLLGESDPVGIYPIGITYNYSNGNTQNLYLTATINEQVNLYAGATKGLYYESVITTNGNTSGGMWQSESDVPNMNIAYLLATTYGNLLVASESAVYLYNGVNSTQVGGDLPDQINSLALDESQNIYAATTAGVYMYDAVSESAVAWTAISDTAHVLPDASNIIGIKSLTESGSTNLYLTTESVAYLCSNVNVSSASYSCIAYTSGSFVPQRFFPNAIALDQSANVYAGTLIGESIGLSSIQSESNLWESQYAMGGIFNSSAYSAVSSLALLNSMSAGTFIYLGLQSSDNTESNLYQCTPTTALCSPVTSSSGNQVTGTISTITTDGAGDLYIAGTNLLSPDWASTVSSNPSAAMLLLNGSAVPTSAWMAVTESEDIESINSLAVVSELTIN